MCKSNKKKKHKFIGIMCDTISFEKGNRLIWVISFLLGVVLSLIAFHPNTVQYFLQYTEIVVDLMLALLAIQVGAYALFHALLSKEVIVILYKTKDANTKKEDGTQDNLLDSSNRQFIGSILVYFYMMIISVFTKMFVSIVPNNFCLFPSLVLTNILAFILLIIFFTANLRVLLESRNFFTNLYEIIRIYCATVIKKNLDNGESQDKTSE